MLTGLIAVTGAALSTSRTRAIGSHLYDRAAQRAGLDPDGAQQATDAVLEALADRISGGEVDDLEHRAFPKLGVTSGSELKDVLTDSSHGASPRG